MNDIFGQTGVKDDVGFGGWVVQEPGHCRADGLRIWRRRRRASRREGRYRWRQGGGDGLWIGLEKQMEAVLVCFWPW